MTSNVCADCKYAVWDELELYPNKRCNVVVDCELGNDEDGCEDFDEYIPPEPEGW